MTATVPRKAIFKYNPVETLLVVEGKKEDTAPATRWCRSNYPWKSYAQPDLALPNPASTVNLDFRHDDKMDVIWGDYGVRAVSFKYAQANVTNANWDSYP